MEEIGFFHQQKREYQGHLFGEVTPPSYLLMFDPITIEFKVRKPLREASLAETVDAALKQIRDKNYDAVLTARGFLPERIRHYGFAFEGKQVLIGADKK